MEATHATDRCTPPTTDESDVRDTSVVPWTCQWLRVGVVPVVCGQGGNTEHFTGALHLHMHMHMHILNCTQFPPLRVESSVLKHPSPPRNDCYHLKWLLSFFSNDCYCIIILCDDVTRDHAALCPWAGPPGAHADLSGRQYVAGRGPLAQARACHHLGSGRPAPTRQAPACRPIASRLK